MFVLSAGVPKTGQTVSATTPVPGGGSITTPAYIKNVTLTVRVTARAVTGATISKTVDMPLSKKKDVFAWYGP